MIMCNPYAQQSALRAQSGGLGQPYRTSSRKRWALLGHLNGVNDFVPERASKGRVEVR